jgi:hypothetical protein
MNLIGKYLFVNGDRYEGNFAKGLYHGQGIINGISTLIKRQKKFFLILFKELSITMTEKFTKASFSTEENTEMVHK